MNMKNQVWKLEVFEYGIRAKIKPIDIDDGRIPMRYIPKDSWEKWIEHYKPRATRDLKEFHDIATIWLTQEGKGTDSSNMNYLMYIAHMHTLPVPKNSDNPIFFAVHYI